MGELAVTRWSWEQWHELPKGYERRIVDIDQGTYWHLYYQGERVNGGLTVTETAAIEESRRLAWVHHYYREDRPYIGDSARLLRFLRYGGETSRDDWDEDWDD